MKGEIKMDKQNEQNMVNDVELEQVAGGNDKITKTAEAVTESGILDYVADKASEAVEVLKYIWNKG